MQVSETAYVHPQAVVTGAVSLGAYSSIWPMTVIRADLSPITIGSYVNIQDGTICHSNIDNTLNIGDYTLVGHRAMLHGCKIGRGCLIGINATILDDAEIGDGAMIMAGCTIRGGKKIPPLSLVLPAGDKVKIIPGKATPLVTILGSLEYYELAKLAKSGSTDTLPEETIEALRPEAERVAAELQLI